MQNSGHLRLCQQPRAVHALRSNQYQKNSGHLHLCQQPRAVHALRSDQYDGVHLYGKNGCQDYTNSVNSILMLPLTDDSQFNNQNGFGTAQRNNHNNCPQAKFQKKPQPNVQTQNRFSVLNSNAGKTCEGWVSPLLV